MDIHQKGVRSTSSMIQDFARYLEEIPDNQLWTYMGMTVEIDPTVDFSSENVLVRWVDLVEEFNDRIIYTSKEQFLTDFQPANA